MQYIISFLEGIITFISPCLLPMIPIYLTYFAGSGVAARTPRREQAEGETSLRQNLFLQKIFYPR